LRAHGRVVRAGKKLVVSTADVFSVEGSRKKQVAFVTATMMVMDTGSGMKD
jgi:acyl-coenzyme A thioesterase PaaI-like protein